MRHLSILLLLLASAVAAYKVAIFAPYVSNSQFLFNKRVAEVLAAHGHSVTLYNLAIFENDYATVKVAENVHQEHVNCSSGVNADELMESMHEVTFKDYPIWDKRQRGRFAFFDEITKSCERLLDNSTFLDGIRGAGYDIAFTHMFGFCAHGIVHLTGILSYAHLIAGPMAEHTAASIGMPAPPSYCSPIMMDAGENMTFVERVKSFLGHIAMPLVVKIRTSAIETEFFRRRFGADFPDLFELSARVPVVFVNTNELYDFARPTLHKVVNIGGLGMTSGHAKPLEKKYEKLVSASADGHIVFTFGSIAPAHRMPLEWKTAFLEAFAAFPNLQFFMRYESPDFSEDGLTIPANVHIAKWLPQADLLQHSNCRGLITHAGYNSLQDAIHAGVPVITIPLFGDQPRNAHLAARLGLGVTIKKTDVSVESVKAAIRSIISDESKRLHAERLKSMVAKKPVSSEQLLVKWTEFVAEFQQLDNLVPFGVHLSTLVYHSVDVIAFLAAALIVLLVLLFYLTRFTLRFIVSLCGKKVKKE